jgi:hypothetical protein
MRTILTALALLLVTTLAGPAQDAGEAQDPARSVIRAQIDAFQQDDFVTAFTYASPNIRAMFQTPERFAAMVVNGYPMVHRPAELRFIGQSMRGDTLVQRVMITDGAGTLHMLEYDIIEHDGTLRINGVRLLRGRDAGV